MTDTASVQLQLPAVPFASFLFLRAYLVSARALESKGTTYFEDEFQDAKPDVDDTLKAFDTILDSASAGKKTFLVAVNRPKMAQLKQGFENLHHKLRNSCECHPPFL